MGFLGGAFYLIADAWSRENPSLSHVPRVHPVAPSQEWFQSRYEWDLLAVRGLWAFGPELQVCINAVY